MYASCSVGAGLSGDGSNYQNIFQADEYYIGNLLFVKGTSLVTDLTFQGIALSIDGNIVTTLLNQVVSSLNKALGATGTLYNGGSSSSSSGSGNSGAAQIGSSSTGSTNLGFGVYLENSGDTVSLFDGYADTYLSYGMLIVITFGLLFVLYFLFPIISIVSLML